MELLRLQEEERNKYILERMDWDKNFVDTRNVLDDNNNKKEALMSELEENQEEKI